MTTQATAIVYPDTDGMPLPDGETQAPVYRRIVVTLSTHFRNVPSVRVNGDTFIYYVEGDPRRSVSPDCYVALDLPLDVVESIERNNVYLLWEVGKAPDFILEIGSESTAAADLGRKRELYAALGAGEYWRYDETGGRFYGEPLVGERLVDGEYRRIALIQEDDGRMWSHSDALNLELWWVDDELRFRDPVTGLWLLSPEEAEDARIVERVARIEAEDARIEAEGRAAEEREARLAAESRMADLEAELLRLRGGR